MMIDKLKKIQNMAEIKRANQVSNTTYRSQKEEKIN